MSDRLPASAATPKRSWRHRYSNSYLPGEALFSRKFDEKRPLTEEEKREVVRSEALETNPPWLRREGGTPDPRAYAETIGYRWFEEDGSELPRVPRFVAWGRDFRRHFTARGRELLVLKALLQQRIADIRWKEAAFRRMRSEYQQAEHIRAWWTEYRENIREDLLDDLRGAYPGKDDDHLRGEMTSWVRRYRQRALAEQQRAALRPRGG